MFTYRFWQLASERAVKTFAQSLVAILSATSVGLLTAPWTMALSTAGMAAVLSVLTSMASAPVGEPNTPSLLPPAPSPAPASPAPASPAPASPAPASPAPAANTSVAAS